MGMKIQDLFPKDSTPVLTVGQVIAELSKLPQDAELHYVAVGDYGIFPVTSVDAEISEDTVNVQF